MARDFERADMDAQAVLQTQAAAEAETIAEADAAIRMAQYHELHNRLEDFVVYMVEMGHLGWQSVYDKRTDPGETLFQLIEEYLDQANEHEDRGPLEQILRPDMTEFSGEPENLFIPDEFVEGLPDYGSTDADPGA